MAQSLLRCSLLRSVAGRGSHYHVVWTFNHGVQGSNPCGLTSKIKYLRQVLEVGFFPENGLGEDLGKISSKAYTGVVVIRDVTAFVLSRRNADAMIRLV